MNIIEKLHGLHEQATKERSHFYVGAVAKEAASEIMLLRGLLARQSSDEGDMASVADLLNTWARECDVAETRTWDAEHVKELICRLWDAANAKRFK